MQLKELFDDRDYGPKEKIGILGQWLREGKLEVEELLPFAEKAKDPVKASCIEAVELALQTNKELVSEALLDFCLKQMQARAPRVLWESAKVIAHCTPRFPDKAEEIWLHLLLQAQHEGTVVRWSVAHALTTVFPFCQDRQEAKRLVLESLLETEPKESIKKILRKGLKQ